ncbi:GATA transcription factor 5-like [Vicia villosa]|uniref:GATA transcription factor 5-like n=1 Tax=Vicia villosa TaxID=3911 RepID=UPI00273C8D9C|nr:GATA transcription factor 5-like [Vicia villosa]
MLHQTHLSLSLFNSLTTSSSSLPSLHPSQAETKMECVNAETAFSDCHVQNIAPVDDFSVDDFLNFSNEEEQEQEQDILEEKQQPQQEQNILEEKQQQNHFHQQNTQNENEISHPIITNQFESLPTTELTVPVEEAANLEWLSYFVEDSFSQFSMTENHHHLQPKAPEPNPTFSTPSFKTPVPGKARSKRTRTGVRVWPVSLVDSSSTSSSTAISSSSSHLEECSKPPEKKPKRRMGSLDGGEARGVLRRCSHCGVQRTPQWRTGPAGPKTLCNACGVRYKSGRLLPEYRPACSPTFSSAMHSNHHRKVLEMRRKKEVVPGSPVQPAAPGL